MNKTRDFRGCGYATLPGKLLALFILYSACLLWTAETGFGAEKILDEMPWKMPAVGDYGLRVLSSRWLELTLITTEEPDVGVTEWDLVQPDGTAILPAASNFQTLVDGAAVPFQVMGFKRRPLYAPLRERDLRISNHLYLRTSQAIPDGASVEILNPGGNLFPPEKPFHAIKDPARVTPVIHLNEVAYVPNFPKKAMVGLYLGNAGELPIDGTNGFQIVDAVTTNVVFEGTLRRRPDIGYTYSNPPYQAVYEADFSSFNQEGEYRIKVPDLGTSLPFRIHSAGFGGFARTYALGLYHQRCGASNSFPFTRHIHDACHTQPAEVPDLTFHEVNDLLLQETDSVHFEPRHTAPAMSNVVASLYPFIRTNALDVSGGHHDAGDYSKYTINSAQLIHALVFSVDALPGVRALDNLGLPESGDGISDLLQIAKWEADFLAKMQDDDGGFYFLVYPRNRRYEHDVLPDDGDPQVVFPKTTTTTAAAVAALAQISSSPAFKEHFPAEAALYLQKARAGWTFLQQAIATHGRDGSYQRITHYGATFLHDDELVWAATELFLATGEQQYHTELLSTFDPSSPSTFQWTWWRLFEGYGCAIRSYVFSEHTGRNPALNYDYPFLWKCKAEIINAANDLLRNSRNNAYGFSVPMENKSSRSAGWFFPSEQAFVLAAGYRLDPRADYLDALLLNLNYEAGCNPINVPFLSGVGFRRQRELVHQYAQNDRRVLPPSGIPIGALQEGFQYYGSYEGELGNLTFPRDGDALNPYAPYDRWGDSFNITTEFVAVQQARALAVSAYLWAQTESASQPWQGGTLQIAGVPAMVSMNQPFTVSLPEGVDTGGAVIVWEARDQEPHIGSTFTFAPKSIGPLWIEVEVLMPDGRRLFAETNLFAEPPTDLDPNPHQSSPLPSTPDLAALYHSDSTFEDATGNQRPMQLTGNARFDMANIAWMAEPTGAAIKMERIGDGVSATITNNKLWSLATDAIAVEMMLFVADFPPAGTNVSLLLLEKNWNAYLEFLVDPYAGLKFRGGTEFQSTGISISNNLPKNQWHHLRLAIGRSGYSARVNGKLVAFFPSREFTNWANPSGSSILKLGNFYGWVDEVAVRNEKNTYSLVTRPQGTTNQTFTLQIDGVPGVEYLLRDTLNLTNWRNLATNRLSASTTNLVFPTTDQRRFFKALQIP